MSAPHRTDLISLADELIRAERLIADLRADNTALRARLGELRHDLKRAQRANRTRAARGGIVRLWDWLNGGTR